MLGYNKETFMLQTYIGNCFVLGKGSRNDHLQLLVHV